ncbi:Na+/H+ antiporter subunit D [candidate division KSB1 bacterium]|nr:Na+/H+ antiporter subunit D [candidate division KSB1 bacterium]
MSHFPEVAFPVLVPLFFGIVCLIFRKHIRLQQSFAIISMIGTLGIAAGLFYKVYAGSQILVLNLGNWSPPFGIVFVADLLSMSMVVSASIIGFVVSIYSISNIDRKRQENYYFAFFNFLIAGVNGAFLTGDIFNLYVFFEVMLMASYALITLGSERSQLEESIKYMVLNLVASAFFVAGVGILYGIVGTLNMADIANKIEQLNTLKGFNSGLLLIVSMIFLTVFGTKGGIFPLYYWLPGSYVAPPASVSAVFGGLLTKVGVYCLLRTNSLIFYRVENITGFNYLNIILVVIGGFTMLLGVFGAIVQYNFKKILSHHIISQVGYMIWGIGMATVSAIAGTILHIIHNIFVKTALFLIGGIHEKLTGTNDLKKTGGLANAVPAVSILFMIAALALAGVPPLSGFFSKYVILKAGFDEFSSGANRYLMVFIIVGLITSLLTLFSMIKIWIFGFWGESKTAIRTNDKSYKALIPSVLILVILAICMGIFAETFYSIAITTAKQLKDPTNYYIKAVLQHQMPR